jgi:hypothetical protein
MNIFLRKFPYATIVVFILTIGNFASGGIKAQHSSACQAETPYSMSSFEYYHGLRNTSSERNMSIMCPMLEDPLSELDWLRVYVEDNTTTDGIRCILIGTDFDGRFIFSDSNSTGDSFTGKDTIYFDAEFTGTSMKHFMQCKLPKRVDNSTSFFYNYIWSESYTWPERDATP